MTDIVCRFNFAQYTSKQLDEEAAVVAQHAVYGSWGTSQESDRKSCIRLGLTLLAGLSVVGAPAVIVLAIIEARQEAKLKRTTKAFFNDVCFLQQRYQIRDLCELVLSGKNKVELRVDLETYQRIKDAELNTWGLKMQVTAPGMPDLVPELAIQPIANLEEKTRLVLDSD
jgi:hypothetical protein